MNMKFMTMNKFMNMSDMTMNDYELYELNFFGSNTIHEYDWHSFFFQWKSKVKVKTTFDLFFDFYKWQFFFTPSFTFFTGLIFFSWYHYEFFHGWGISVLALENWFFLLSRYLQFKFFFHGCFFYGKNFVFHGVQNDFYTHFT